MLMHVSIIVAVSIASAIPVQAATYYVSTTGNDANAGTSLEAPLRTISKAVNRAAAGDSVLVRGGTYREQVDMIRGGTALQPINVLAYPGEVPIIKGSEIVTGWTQDSPVVWKKTGWPHNSQQVFVDFNSAPRKSLQQIGMPSAHYTAWEYPKPVGSGRSSMVPGSFYYDAAAATLYVRLADGSNPNRRVIEASVRRRLFFMHQPYVYLRGFAFRHSNVSAFTQQGAAVELSAKSTIELCDIQYTDFSGLSMGYLQDGARAYNCTVSNNGDSGVVAAGSTNFLVAKVAMNGNNSRNFNARWHAGGFKGTSNAFGTVENCEVGGNNGSGIWFDYARSGNPVVIRNNYLHDNGPLDSAIFFEVSSAGRIYNNVLVRNRLRGVYLAASINTQVYNNTIVATSERAGIEVAGMPRSGATLTGNQVTNNIISHGTGQYDLFIMPDNGSSITRNRSDYNVFYRATGFVELWSNTLYSDLAAWRAATGHDAHSVIADPRFVPATTPPSASNYAVAPGSPAIDAGADLGGVLTMDYLGARRPSGPAFDIGAFEAAAAVAKDTTPPDITIYGGTSVLGSGGSLTITASATDNVGVVAMRLYIDDVLKASSSTGEISYAWPAPTVGLHALRVTATDAAQNTTTAASTLTIQ